MTWSWHPETRYLPACAPIGKPLSCMKQIDIQFRTVFIAIVFAVLALSDLARKACC